MRKLNVQVEESIFYRVNDLANKYHVTRAAAVAMLLTFALDHAQFVRSIREVEDEPVYQQAKQA